MKIPPIFVSIILCLSTLFLLLFFHAFCFNNFTTLGTNTAASSTTRISHRKVLLMASKFDFSPFLRHRHHYLKHLPQPAAGSTDMDPRYGVEKRLVPTGPNPLHH
ncbi:hypothetical protein CUMW_184250 [Citrus unshiu]|uniref:Uncharacterized protein n=1 Tax=Citrus sinensis TaxID=2711 RepID=A0A067FM15_CITSI|nr:hypothetical protein CISIN_1g034076mg [Citrus sinensis]GAY58069.1 hypothetical protein CUMW_184250 [Citrus unshiu]